MTSTWSTAASAACDRMARATPITIIRPENDEPCFPAFRYTGNLPWLRQRRINKVPRAVVAGGTELYRTMTHCQLLVGAVVSEHGDPYVGMHAPAGFTSERR